MDGVLTCKDLEEALPWTARPARSKFRSNSYEIPFGYAADSAVGKTER